MGLKCSNWAYVIALSVQRYILVSSEQQTVIRHIIQLAFHPTSEGPSEHICWITYHGSNVLWKWNPGSILPCEGYISDNLTPVFYPFVFGKKNRYSMHWMSLEHPFVPPASETMSFTQWIWDVAGLMGYMYKRKTGLVSEPRSQWLPCTASRSVLHKAACQEWSQRSTLSVMTPSSESWWPLWIEAQSVKTNTCSSDGQLATKSAIRKPTFGSIFSCQYRVQYLLATKRGLSTMSSRWKPCKTELRPYLPAVIGASLWACVKPCAF